MRTRGRKRRGIKGESLYNPAGTAIMLAAERIRMRMDFIFVGTSDNG
jgi:hypothetical protein